MPLLGVIPGGQLLEPPIDLVTRCDLSYEQLYAQITEGLLTPQREFVEEKTAKIVGYCAGFGCLGGEVEINGVPIQDLTRAPIEVETLFGRAWATPAYRKGFAALYQVRTEAGQVFVATKDHRCLTPAGWLTVGHLSSGSLVAVDGRGSEHSWSETATDWSASDRWGARSCDGLPSPAEVASQELAQRLCGPSIYLNHGLAQSLAEPWTADYAAPAAHPESLGRLWPAETSAWSLHAHQTASSVLAPPVLLLGSPAKRWPPDQAAFRTPSPAEWAAANAPSTWSTLPAPPRTSPRDNPWRTHTPHPAPAPPTRPLPASPSASNAFPSPKTVESFQFTWSRIKDITFLRYDDFYDLHVPVWNHYVANGVLHHNSGKTHGLCAKAVAMAMDNPGTVGAVFEPTHIMIRDVWMRSFDDFLEQHQIQHDFRVSPQPEYTLYLPNGPCTILCRATETWNRIRGQNLSFACIDEVDTSPADVAQKASEMVLARLRGGASPQLAVASTPEGYRWMYRTFVESPSDDKRLIRAKTTDNPHLPPGFVESLYANFPPQLIRSYIEGEFTNLANTSVYPDYDRDRHWSDATIAEGDRIYCGVDLNVGNCMIEVLVRRGEVFHFVEEHVVRDTPAIVTLLQERYGPQHERGDVVVIPDAASRQRTTTNAKESDLSILKRGGFAIKEQLSNPAIEDRVNAMNMLLMNDRLKVHANCKHLIKSLEQQAYDKSGKPEKGGSGLDDPSHPVDAAGYAISALAPLRRWMTGGSRFRTY